MASKSGSAPSPHTPVAPPAGEASWTTESPAAAAAARAARLAEEEATLERARVESERWADEAAAWGEAREAAQAEKERTAEALGAGEGWLAGAGQAAEAQGARLFDVVEPALAAADTSTGAARTPARVAAGEAERLLCPVCFDATRSAALPCGHAVCAGCAARLDGRCAECKRPFARLEVRPLYLT